MSYHNAFITVINFPIPGYVAVAHFNAVVMHTFQFLHYTQELHPHL